MDDGVAKVEEVDLPHDLIVHNILTRLPIKPLLKFKCVSKQWYSTLSSYQFAHIYTKLSLFPNPSSPTQYLFIQYGSNYYLFSYDDDVKFQTSVDYFARKRLSFLKLLGSQNRGNLESQKFTCFVDDDIGTYTCNVNKSIYKLRNNFHVALDGKLVLIGSCNGLVCLASTCGYFFILWNPITGKFQKYSDLELSIDSSIPFCVSWGFGYVSNVDDFKVVRILELPATLEIRVHVFSLKSNKWTRIADELHQDIFSLRSPTVGRFTFNSHHTSTPLQFPFTFCSRRGVLVDETLYWIVSKTDGLGRKIVAFDLVSEVFDANVDLDLKTKELYRDDFICNMGGCLSKVGCNMRSDVYIHILKYPGNVESIFLSRDLMLNFLCKDLVGFTGTGKFFIQVGASEIGLIDPISETKMYTPLVKFKRSGSSFARTSYIASFVPSLTLPYTVEEFSGKHNTC